MIKYRTTAYLILLIISSLNINAQNPVRIRENFNKNWKFKLNPEVPAWASEFNDNDWRQLNLPHDWSIEGEFSENNPATPGGGALPGGTGWYRKTFTIPSDWNSKQIYLTFDGVYRNSEVWINGHYLGLRPFGYITFRYELTPFLNFGNTLNVIAVKVDNSQQPNSRWYSGSGIYRNVWIEAVNSTHIDLWGTCITTPEIKPNEALVNLDIKILSKALNKKVSLITTLYSQNGEQVAQLSQNDISIKDTLTSVSQVLKVAKPELWSTESPFMYKAITRIISQNKTIDEYTTPFAIRYFNFSAENGFSLNGKSFKIQGVCMHHDLGALGTALNISALHRQLEILKGMGVNGIRTSHNPPAPELLDMCDTMGFIVMDEAFDIWRKRKSTYDYASYFDKWHQKDLTDMILRDRNHPSIFMWSVGNEVLEQWDKVDADTMDLKEANLILNFAKKTDTTSIGKNDFNINTYIARQMVQTVKDLDKTRPVLTANNEPAKWNNMFKSGAMDIIGFNYHEQYIADVPSNFPNKPFIGTENVSALMTRGYYRMPSDSFYIWPERWDIPFYDSSFSCSSYDNCHVPWGNTHEETLRNLKKYSYMSGAFIWTGFDYLGEPTPYGWPARSSFFGIVDLAGFPKDVYYLYKSEWTNKTTLHIFPHWNWKPGEMVDIWAYYNNADEVELYLNEKSLGAKSKKDGDYHVFWRIPFEAGTLKAVSRKAGKIVATNEIKTSGTPYKIVLIPDKQTINANGEDLDFVTVKVVDKDGVLAPDATNLINFEVSGNGKLEAVDNGNPTSLESFKASSRKAFYGLCLAIIRPSGSKGEIKIKASSPGLESATIQILTR